MFPKIKRFYKVNVNNKCFKSHFFLSLRLIANQVVIAQRLAKRLATLEVPGSNPGMGENFSVKINNWIVLI